MKPTIHHQITEAQAWVNGAQNDAARPGKGQELARMRLANAQAILATLEWCRDNADELRAFRATHNPEHADRAKTRKDER